MLPEIREYCAANPGILHYEVETLDQVGEAIRTVSLVSPSIIVINGGDGTVQAVLTELYSNNQYKGTPPPVAILPNGKTNLIAGDLGATGSPMKVLQQIVDQVAEGTENHIIERQLIALRTDSNRLVLGMFFSGAYLANVMLYCRNRIYPLGLPNGLSHFLAAFLSLVAIFLGLDGGRFLPKSTPVRVSLLRGGELRGRFSILIVTSLERLLFRIQTQGTARAGNMKFLAVDWKASALLRMFKVSRKGKLGREKLSGIHFEEGDEIMIGGDRPTFIFDGELFEAKTDQPIRLTTTAPVPFLRLTAEAGIAGR